MKIWQLWFEMCFFLCEDEMSTSLKQYFDLVRDKMEVLLRALTDVGDEELDHEKGQLLARDLEKRLAIDHEMEPRQKDMWREAKRMEAVLERNGELWNLVEKTIGENESDPVRERLENFICREWHLHRRGMVIDRHFDSKAADKIKAADKMMPDMRTVWAAFKDLKDEHPNDDPEEVAGKFLSMQPPGIMRQEASVVIACAHFRCKLEFESEEEACETAAVLQSRFKQDRKTSKRFRNEPTLKNLLTFLGRALPDDSSPYELDVEVI